MKTKLFWLLFSIFGCLSLWFAWPRSGHDENLADNALAQALCVVLVVGSDVILGDAPTAIANKHLQCLIRVSSQPAPAFEPGPPFNLIFEPIQLTSDQPDSAPIGLSSTGRVHILASTYIASLEKNRLSAVVARVISKQDVNVVKDLIHHTYDYLEFVIIQACEFAEFENVSLLEKILKSLEYKGIKPLFAYSSVCSSEEWWQRSRTSTLSPPKQPEYFLSYENWGGRFSNQLICVSAAVLLTRDSLRTLVVQDDVYGRGFVPLLLNMTQLGEIFGEPNRVLSFEEMTTIPTLGWCPNTLVRGRSCAALTLEYAQNCLVDDCSLCRRHIPMAHRAFVWESSKPGLRSRPCFPAPDGGSDIHDLSQPAIFLPGGTVFESFPVFPASERNKSSPLTSTEPKYVATAWLTFSPIVAELAQLQLQLIHEQLRQQLKQEPAQWRLLGVHLRLGDYADISPAMMWQHALIELQKQLAESGLDPFHGLIVCSDDDLAKSDLYQQIVKLFVGTVVFNCLPQDLSPLEGINLAVIQSVLEKVSCFVGLKVSTFSWRIQARRILDNLATPCDLLIDASKF